MTAPTEAAPEVVEQPNPDAGEWRVRFPVMALEGADTSDGRYLTPGTIIARACPLSILAQPFASHGGQEPPPAVVVGRLDTVERVPGPSVTSRVTGEPFPEGTFVWVGHGAVDPSIDVHGLNIGNLLKRRFLNGASVDLAGMDVEMVGEEGFDADPDNPRRQMIAHRGEQAAITLVPIPAFGDAYVELVGDDEPMVEPDPEEFPEGFCASAFPSWRSAEIGDYPALVASGEAPWPASVPPMQEAVAELAAVIADDNGEQRDASELAAAIVQHIHEQWASGDSDTEVPDGEEVVVAAADTPEPEIAAADHETGMPDAPQDCEATGTDTYESEVGPHPAVRSLLYDDSQRYAATCDEHDAWTRERIGEQGYEVEQVVEIEQAPEDNEETPA